MANKGLYVAGGAILVLSAAGIAYWLYEKHMLPQAYIGSANATRASNGIVTVAAQVTNTGKRAGYFKIQALVISPSACPYTGQSGKYGLNWDQITSCVASQPGINGVWVGAPESTGFQVIKAGESKLLQATAPPPISPGTYNIYVNAAVSKDGTSAGRIKDREYYFWVPNYSIT